MTKVEKMKVIDDQFVEAVVSIAGADDTLSIAAETVAAFLPLQVQNVLWTTSRAPAFDAFASHEKSIREAIAAAI